MTRLDGLGIAIVGLLSLLAGRALAAPLTYFSTDVPKGNVDAATVFSLLPVPDDIIVGSLTVRVDVLHTFDADVDLFLLGPTGLTVELSTDNGASGDNYTNTVFDDAAAASILAGTPPFTGSFRPEQPLAAFAGTGALGTWRLQFRDDAAGFSGTLTGWSLTITPIPEPGTPALLLTGLGLLGLVARRAARRPS
jgi:subtilisin-like proprotein convertase family protein